jgi:hypothetical protein
MAMAGEQRPKSNMLDVAAESLLKLIGDQGAVAASGRFGVVLTLERGEPRKVALLMEPTVMTATKR